MAHVIESAPTGRARCRGCERNIAKGELRFGERQPNPYAEGETTLWFHLWCAAYKRPEPFLEALDPDADADADADDADVDVDAEGDADTDSPKEPPRVIPEREALRAAAELGVTHRRLPRIHGADRAPTGRARCRSCREPIRKGSWRIALVYFEEYRFQPSGFIHAGCAGEYFGTTGIAERVRHFTPDLTEEELADVEAAFNSR